MTRDDAAADANRLAAESLAERDPTGWFERLYAAAADGEAVVPWARGEPHPVLLEWVEARPLNGRGRRALVVGAGLGDDAELVAERAYETVAFVIAASAIESARRRFPDSRVSYVVADLLDPPDEWREAFDLVVESLTVQSLPPRLHANAAARVGSFVGPGGTLLVVSTARDEAQTVHGPPWPLARSELDAFASSGLEAVRIEHIRASDVPPRWRAEFRRA